ncbi:MAG: UDP-N-acetylmuramoyl-tripeptide--D-alanyl-D-alanine ligase [Gemmatimonadota bacterium]
MSNRFWNDREVRTALGLDEGTADPVFAAISTDTRKIAEGDLFVALQGDNFDGHDFLAVAAEAGARGVVISDPSAVVTAGVKSYVVDDTLIALGRLAHHRRLKLTARFIGVVGSNGKTSTKELIRAVVATRFRTAATEGNLNNRIGVPLTLLGIPEDTEVAVIEMGTNRPGEIATLGEIVRPDTVVITSIGEEHLELLGDLEGVLAEETSVLESLASGGLAFVADTPDTLPRRAREMIGRNRVRVAGIGEGAEIRPDGGDRGIQVLEDGGTRWRWRGVEVELPIPGRFNVRNALLALGIALDLSIPSQDAVRSLGSVRLPKLRGEWHRHGELRVLADCYNANPPSVAAAVELLGSLPARGRRIAVLGTMRELGESAAQLHAASASRIAKMVGDRIDLVVATGEFAPAFAAYREKLGDQVIISEDPLEAYERVRPELRPTDTILLKASRGDQLERWLPLLERDLGAAEV